ncbi:MAG: hypothetical protein U1F54_05575 [Burkholderiales bacterium]
MKLEWSYQDFPDGSKGTIGPASTSVIAVAECKRGGFAITGLADRIDTPDDDEPALLHIWEGGPVDPEGSADLVTEHATVRAAKRAAQKWANGGELDGTLA